MTKIAISIDDNDFGKFKTEITIPENGVNAFFDWINAQFSENEEGNMRSNAEIFDALSIWMLQQVLKPSNQFAIDKAARAAELAVSEINLGNV